MTTDRVLAEITVVGPDRYGVVAGVTNFIFENRGNIEKIDQNVIRGLFGMQLEASFKREAFDKPVFTGGLHDLAKKLRMKMQVHFDEPTRLKNMALLVSKEPHCLEAILEAKKRGKIGVNIPLIVGSEGSLKAVAKKYRVPFFLADANGQENSEAQILRLMERFNVDFIVLARYMRIFSPNFVWRYPNRIINIHPSILPAFTGAYAYVQAYDKGAQIIGCTAHFVTPELDQGPIILQDSFRIKIGESLEKIVSKGRELEAKTLLNAVKLYLENKLEVYWGKVHLNKKGNA